MEKPDLQKILDECADAVRLTYGANHGPVDEFGDAESVTVAVAFSIKGFGFGSITIRSTPEGTFLDSEHMSRDRVKQILGMLVDSAILDTDLHSEEHALYNKVMNRMCGEGCAVCHPPRCDDPVCLPRARARLKE